MDFSIHVLLLSSEQWTIPLNTIIVTFYHDSLHAQRFQMLITSLFKSICLSNLIGGLSNGRGN